MPSRTESFAILVFTDLADLQKKKNWNVCKQARAGRGFISQRQKRTETTG